MLVFNINEKIPIDNFQDVLQIFSPLEPSNTSLPKQETPKNLMSHPKICLYVYTYNVVQVVFRVKKR